jgi:L-ascorbate oxidase
VCVYGPLAFSSRHPPLLLPFLPDARSFMQPRLLQLSDWWHMEGREHTAGLVAQPFRWTGDPQSLLHNGKGNYTCGPPVQDPGLARFKCTPQAVARGFEVVPVERGKTYLLRVISTTSLSYLDLAIEGHTLTVVEADGACSFARPPHISASSGLAH